MLQLIRFPQNKLAAFVIRLQNTYCTTSSRKVTLLRTRFRQRQLYGRIIGEVYDIETKKNVTESAISKDTNKKLKALSSRKASEFYWLVQRAEKPKIFTSRKSIDKNESKTPVTNTSLSRSDTNTNQIDSIDNVVPKNISQKTKLNTMTAVISAKNLLRKIVPHKHVDRQNRIPQEIPFVASDLDSILNYPLICKKGSKSQQEDLIADTSIQIPSISKVLQATMPESSRFALQKWKLGKVAELGLDGFKQYEKESLHRGKEFHSAIECFLKFGKYPDSNSSIIKLWESIDSSLNELTPKAILLEQPVLHTDLKYRGIIDNVSMVKKELCAFEWKTSEKCKSKLAFTYDAPVQLCAYLGALNIDPRYDLTVKNGRVVVAYKNGDTANIFHLTETDLRKYWLIWLKRLQEYWIRVRDGTLPDPI